MHAANAHSWRDLPAGFGNWTSVAQRFRRWAKGGVFARFSKAIGGGLDFEYALIDSTIVQNRQKASRAEGSRALARRADHQDRGTGRSDRKSVYFRSPAEPGLRL